MKELDIILEKENYRKIKFRITKTRHLLLKAEINGVKGRFILDTGASNTCICSSNIFNFKLEAQNCSTKAVGAGNSDILTQIANNNIIKIGKWKTKDFPLVILDLSHVNGILTKFRTQPVDGIIGADVLLKSEAVLDYKNNYLYLR